MSGTVKFENLGNKIGNKTSWRVEFSFTNPTSVSNKHFLIQKEVKASNQKRNLATGGVQQEQCSFVKHNDCYTFNKCKLAAKPGLEETFFNQNTNRKT